MSKVTPLPLAARRRRPTRRRVKLAVRLSITVVLLALVYGTTNLGALFDTLASVSLATATAVGALYLLSQVLSCSKWWIILQGVGLPRSRRDTLRAYFLGMFINTFGLGTLGGDVVRAVAIKPPKGKRTAALATVVADRLQGLAVLASIGAIAVCMVRPPVLGPYALYLALPIPFVVALGLWLGPRMITGFLPPQSKPAAIARDIRSAFPETLGTQLKITVIATAFHVTQICTYYLIARELNAPLSLGYLFATVPIINVVSTLPISINGYGVREMLTLSLFGAAGTSETVALAFSAIWVLAVTIVSASAGVLITVVSGESIEETKQEAARVREEVALEERAARAG